MQWRERWEVRSMCGVRPVFSAQPKVRPGTTTSIHSTSVAARAFFAIDQMTRLWLRFFPYYRPARLRGARERPRRAVNAGQAAMFMIRSYRSEDEAAIVDLWRRCGLVRPQNDRAKTSSGNPRSGRSCFSSECSGKDRRHRDDRI